MRERERAIERDRETVCVCECVRVREREEQRDMCHAQKKDLKTFLPASVDTTSLFSSQISTLIQISYLLPIKQSMYSVFEKYLLPRFL